MSHDTALGKGRCSAQVARERSVTRRSIVVGVISLATLGGGLFNLYSVIAPPTPARLRVLQEVLPLEFLQLSRSLTLLFGFSLVISSLNLYRGKKRAWQIVSVLTGASVLFHLIKGLDYEQALVSFVLLLALLLSRRRFTVKSGAIDFHWAAVRLGMALSIAILYGVGGLWLLDVREFGINFHLRDSIHRTVLLLSLVGDPQLVPHTRYARWFLDSLYLMTYTAIGYSAFALFRPVLYEYHTLPRERALATEIVNRYGRSSLDSFKLWPDKSYFFSPSMRSFLAYGVRRSFALVLGDPVGPVDDIQTIIREFVHFCRDNDWALGFYQARPDFLPVYRQAGLKKLKVGDDAIVDLQAFSLEGRERRALRADIRRLESMGIKAQYFQTPLSEELLDQAREVSQHWLQIPGRKERGFTLGRFDPDYVRSTPLFAAFNRGGQMLAFVNLIPSYVSGEATGDLMRRRQDAPNGIMDFLFAKLFLQLPQKGFERFDLGMAPMSGFKEREEASAEERAVHNFFQQLNFVFSFKGLRHYKAKFASYWEPRYVVYRNVLDLPRLALTLRRVSELQEEE